MKYALLVIALLLLLPAALTSGVFGPTVEDMELAVMPVIRLLVDALKRAGSASVIFEVPTGRQWARLRDAWGEPDYAVFGLDKSHGSIVAWSSLGIAVTASMASGPLPLEEATSVPDGYSSSVRDFGVILRPGSGGRVRLDFAVVNPNSTSAAEIVIQPQWGNMKDRLVGVALTPHLRPHIRVVTVVGVLLLAVVALIRD